MKELLTKKFWRDVKRTFDQAREESPNHLDSRAASPAEANPKDSQAAKDQAPPEAVQPPD